MDKSTVISVKPKETSDRCAVFWRRPRANLLYLFRAWSDAFLCDHMRLMRNPFLEEKTLLWLISLALAIPSKTCFNRSNSSSKLRPITITSSR